MPLSKDFSIVADSTISSSPPPTTPPPAKRPARTYGRPKAVEEPSPTSFDATPPSTISVFRTGHSDNDEEIPPSSGFASEPDDADDENDDQEESRDASHTFKYTWQEKLKAMDEQEDFDITDAPAAGQEQGASNSQQTLIDPLSPVQRESNPGDLTVPNSPVTGALAPSLSKSLFDGSLSTVTASSFTSPSGPRVASLPSSPPSGVVIRRTKKRISTAVLDSDSDGTTNTKSPFTSSQPNHIPKSTPPTTDDEMPAHVLNKSSSKGKGKASASSARKPLSFEAGQGDDSSHSSKKPTKETRVKKVKTKIKAPTQKEILETKKERLRLAEAQSAAIPRAATTNKYTLTALFDAAKNTRVLAPASSEIEDFSSPAHAGGFAPLSAPPLTSTLRDDPFILKSSLLKPPVRPATPPSNAGSDSEDLPEIGSLIQDDSEKRAAAEKQQRIFELKKRALAQQQANQRTVASDDSDLEIADDRVGGKMQVAVAEEAEERRSARKKIPEGRKRQLLQAGLGITPKPTGGSSSTTGPIPLTFGSSGKGKKRVSGPKSHLELNRMLIQKVSETGAKETKKKEEEFIRRGGKAAVVQDTGKTVKDILGGYQAKAEALEADGMDVDEDEDEDPSDEDWMPEMRGSASPSPRGNDDEPGSGEERYDADEDVTMVQEDEEDYENDENDENDENSAGPVHLRARRPRALVESDSEEENDENSQPVPMLGAAYDEFASNRNLGFQSSTDERTEDEGDKENGTGLGYDKSDDKENKAVVRHPLQAVRPPLASKGSLFGLEESVRRGLSMSPGGPLLLADDADDEGENDGRRGGVDARAPFKVLSDEDPFGSPPIPFAARLQKAQRSPSPLLHSASISSLQPSPSFRPRVLSQSLEFSQFPSEEPVTALLQPGFSQLYESGSFKPTQSSAHASSSNAHGGAMGGMFGKRNLGRTDTLDLTQDIGLRPAFQVPDHLKQQADLIFEKEQDYVLENANQKPTKKEELYVNEHGFLTQTRPDSDAEIYHPSALTPSQSLASLRAHSSMTQASFSTSQRRPLQSLSVTSSVFDLDDETPDHPSQQPLRRLTRRREDSPTNTRVHATHQSQDSPPSARPLNAFDQLARASKARAKAEKIKSNRAAYSEFVQEQAQESDDDEMFGFGGRNKGGDDDEADGEDLDMNLETLVDDKDMDEATVAAEKVLEKVREHRELDDQALEKLHLKAVQGDLRKKKRHHGVGFDDSDDEDEDGDDRNRRVRRGMNKKQRMDIKHLGESEDTKAFAQVYENGVKDDDDDGLAYLLEPSTEDQDSTMVDARQNSDDEEDEDDEQDAAQKFITTSDLHRQLREAGQNENLQDSEELDPNNVDWVDGNGSDEETRVKIKTLSRAAGSGEKGPHKRTLDAVFDGAFETEQMKPAFALHDRHRMQSWAKTESRSRNVATSRSVVGGAVTGHAKKVKAGAGSIRGVVAQASSSHQSKETRSKSLKPAASILARTEEHRSTKFKQC